MAIITLGLLDKKLYLIIAIAIVRTINAVVSEETDGYYNGVICSMEEEVGSVIFGVITIFIFKPKKEKKREDKNNFKYLFILFMLRFTKSLYERIYRYAVPDKYYRYNTILNTINGFEIFLMSLVTFILLKYKYYIHHMISMAIFCFLGILNDYILGNYFLIGYKYIYVYIIYIINEVFVFCYLKYMMDKLYYHYTELLLIWGIVGVIVKVFIFSGRIIYEYVNDIDGIVNGIKTYFTETNIFTIIFLQFFYFLFDGGLYYLLTILELYYLRPNHMLISDEINVYEKIFFYEERQNKIYSLFVFLFQMIILLFYYEILEFNFWGLNKNTAKSIQMREGNDEESRETISEIELGDQYYVNNNSSRGSNEGLNDISENISFSNKANSPNEKMLYWIKII